MLPKKYDPNQPDGGAVIKGQNFEYQKVITFTCESDLVVNCYRRAYLHSTNMPQEPLKSTKLDFLPF